MTREEKIQKNWNETVASLRRERGAYSVGDLVLWHGQCYEVTRKRMGVDMYEIAKVHRYNGHQYMTCVHDGLSFEELEPYTDDVIENEYDMGMEKILGGVRHELC